MSLDIINLGLRYQMLLNSRSIRLYQAIKHIASGQQLSLSLRTAEVQAQIHSVNTLKGYKAAGNKFICFMKDFGWRCFRITSDQLSQYVVHLFDVDKMKVSSIRTNFTNLKGFLNHFEVKMPNLSDVEMTMDGLSRCTEQSVRRAAPLQGDHLAKLEKLFTGFDYDAINAHTARQLLNMEKLQFITISSAAHNGSFRINELLNLTWDKIVENDQGFRLSIDKSKTNQIGPAQEVYLSFHDGNHTSAASWLKIYRQRRPSESWVFPRLANKSIVISASYFNQQIKNYADQLGLDKSLFSTHSFRSGCTTDMIEANVHPENIRKHLRWTTTDMIATYSRPSEESWQGTLKEMFDSTGGSKRARRSRGYSPQDSSVCP